MKGVVKSFSRLKGYGFIQSKELEHDVFIHYTNIDDMDGFKTLNVNDEVIFQYDKIEKKAVHVIKRK
ncbi:cold shock domain-containing protein [[Clostridium] innocuum]|nr:cold shock domain-containing protein [[Clostridium] innocuum]